MRHFLFVTSVLAVVVSARSVPTRNTTATAHSSSLSASPSTSSAGPPQSATSSPAVQTVYPQPPLPNRWAFNDPSIYTLSGDFEITDIPRTREYYFSLDAVANGKIVAIRYLPDLVAPDGYARQMFTVNGQFPGPLIQANEGDRVVIHMVNNLEIDQTIHWHGITQNGSQWMDGIGGISQCPIPANGGTFTYDFTISNQYGSYWYHSHYAATLADGLVGGIVVHSPSDPLKRGVDFDEDRILYVQDLLHDQSDVIVAALKSPQGYRGAPAAPEPDAILINGVGATNCTAAPAGSNCTTPAPPEILVPAGKRIRFRVLNTGAHAMLRLSLDKHPFEIIEADDTPVYGSSDVHEAPVGPGQRYSLLVTTDKGEVGDTFPLRVTAASACLVSAFRQTMVAHVRYVDDNGNYPEYGTPHDQPWHDLDDPLTAACDDLTAKYPLAPRVAENAPTEVLDTHVFNSQFGQFVGVDGVAFQGFGFNSIAYQNQINYPLLAQVENGLSPNPSLIASVTYQNSGGGDIIFNNLDPNLPHPIHLHGRSFYIVARGQGNITDLHGVEIDTNNPLRRDTTQISAASYMVLRLVTDTPGVWPIHCHIAWHLSVGKLGAVVIQPDAVYDFEQPAEWLGLCAGTDPQAFGPDKRNIISA
ncbi:multi-copper oxidase laccase-like protein [Naematelia encephala]|uniref:Multi-copper oxidase laccase-like protein n=1 Tax=Naematelia encephala TaxID=71784 RepID=A0A1Y2B4E1_9TREE|nr:multi-copper oxidase laccase-like protein [Naematelia encephala]